MKNKLRPWFSFFSFLFHFFSFSLLFFFLFSNFLPFFSYVFFFSLFFTTPRKPGCPPPQALFVEVVYPCTRPCVSTFIYINFFVVLGSCSPLRTNPRHAATLGPDSALPFCTCPDPARRELSRIEVLV